jgi:ADP-heptose:LPS heptosyltransferase
MNPLDKSPDSILFIRRDNIGDLVCTTPAIRAVRKRFPEARIAVLVNTYNAEMVRNNPDVDELFVYEKAKHAAGRGRLGVWFANARLMRRIRAEGFDVAIGCGSSSARLAMYTYMTGARERIGYSITGKNDRYYNRALREPDEDMHEVEKTFALLKPLGIEADPETGPGPMVLVPDAEEAASFAAFRKERLPKEGLPLLAVAISARIEVNKWPEEKFVELIGQVLYKKLADVLLLWAPGSKANPFFPGEDEVAGRVLENVKGRIMAYPTPTLSSLVAAMAASDIALNLDTGSLHIAAALQVPTVALITNRKAPHWYPWKAPNTVLKAETVAAISVETTLDAVSALITKCKEASP